MRCNVCHSYIPAGVDPDQCPNCGSKNAQGSTNERAQSSGQTQTSSIETTTEKKLSPITPYFTIKTKLSFSIAGISRNLSQKPGPGSISFGENGFSIVSDQGKKLDKILYKDLLSFKREKDKVKITSLNDTEKELVLFNPMVPSFLLFGKGSSERASLFCELLEIVRGGLTADQVRYFSNKLGS